MFFTPAKTEKKKQKSEKEMAAAGASAASPVAMAKDKTSEVCAVVNEMAVARAKEKKSEVSPLVGFILFLSRGEVEVHGHCAECAAPGVDCTHKHAMKTLCTSTKSTWVTFSCRVCPGTYTLEVHTIIPPNTRLSDRYRNFIIRAVGCTACLCPAGHIGTVTHLDLHGTEECMTVTEAVAAMERLRERVFTFKVPLANTPAPPGGPTADIMSKVAPTRATSSS